MREHGIEPVRGLPAELPKGERMLWQGAPDWRALARHTMHVRKIGVYFAVVLVWFISTRVSDGAGAGATALSALRLAALAAIPLALLAGYAWLTARTTVYTLTDRRLVVRFGIALPMTFNIPFAKIVSANLKAYAGGAGDVAVDLAASERIAYLILWPHARRWRLFHAEPTLRCIPEASRVAQILGRALAASAAMPAPANPVAAGEPARPRAAALA